DAASKVSCFRAALDLGTRSKPIALLIDDADELSPGDRLHLEALLRATPSDGGLAVFVATRQGDLGSTTNRVAIDLAPLSITDVRSWLRAEIPEAALDTILRATGGYPKEIASVLAQLDGGAW